jgi:alanine racemase
MRLRPALALKARITQIKAVPPGQPVSYGGTFTVRRPSTVAIVPLGYADGYSRHLSNRGEVLIRGRRCPVIGAVCMDQMVVDVTDVPGVALGEKVILIGSQGSDEITVGELARKGGSITHEVVSQLGARLPRVWVEEARSAGGSRQERTEGQ